MTAFILCFKWPTYYSVYNGLRCSSDCVCNWICFIGFFFLPEASKDFLYPQYKSVATLEEKKLEEQKQISHARTKWLKSCWIRKWKMHQFWNYKTPIRVFTLVNTGWSVKHATWLRAGDSGCEIEISRSPDAWHFVWLVWYGGTFLWSVMPSERPSKNCSPKDGYLCAWIISWRVYYFPVTPERV